jgi:hypothetical protein
MRIRAQVTDVTISGPNFKGTRILTGRKYTFAPVGLMSVFFAMRIPYGLNPHFFPKGDQKTEDHRKNESTQYVKSIKKNFKHLSNKIHCRHKDCLVRFAEADHPFVCPISSRIAKRRPPCFQTRQTVFCGKPGARRAYRINLTH